MMVCVRSRAMPALKPFYKSGVTPARQDSSEFLDTETAVERGIPALDHIEIQCPVVLI